MTELDGYTYIGKISKTYGYEGGVMVVLDVEDPEEYEELESVFVEFNGKLTPFFIKEIQSAGLTNLRIWFHDYDSDEKIEEFVGCPLYLPDDCFPKFGVDYFDETIRDIVGYTAIEKSTGKILGEIYDIVENPAHPLFEIKYNGKSILIPAVEAFIQETDSSQKIIYLSLPEGILDI